MGGGNTVFCFWEPLEASPDPLRESLHKLFLGIDCHINLYAPPSHLGPADPRSAPGFAELERTGHAPPLYARGLKNPRGPLCPRELEGFNGTEQGSPFPLVMSCSPLRFCLDNQRSITGNY